MPQDRRSSFEPKVVQKRQKDISDIDSKIISMYAKGMTTRQISETIEDIYGFDVSEGFISDVTDKLLPQIEDSILTKFNSRVAGTIDRMSATLFLRLVQNLISFCIFTDILDKYTSFDLIRIL